MVWEVRLENKAETGPWGLTTQAGKFWGAICWFLSRRLLWLDPCWGSSTEDGGRTLAPSECDSGRSALHPPTSSAGPWERNAKGGRGQGKELLDLSKTLQSLLSWAQQRKINHLSNGRGQALLCDCLIRCKITPQVRFLGGPQGSNPTASDKSNWNLDQNENRKDTKAFHQPLLPSSYQFE